jgi:hypothetical protein
MRQKQRDAREKRRSTKGGNPVEVNAFDDGEALFDDGLLEESKAFWFSLRKIDGVRKPVGVSQGTIDPKR